MKLVALGARGVVDIINRLFAALAALSRHRGCTNSEVQISDECKPLKDQLRIQFHPARYLETRSHR
jgi:hypothetical protein